MIQIRGLNQPNNKRTSITNQEHIRAFGGDPARITIIGQSSGGTSVLALLASPASKGLFHVRSSRNRV